MYGPTDRPAVISTGDLYPEIEPYNTGYLLVAGGHSIYYEECGNPDGYPVLYVHGGPGAGCGEKDRRFINPENRIILFDQRGCGRSKPFGSIQNNTTDDLLSDMWNLLRHLGIKKTIPFGGSWGSTLSLLFWIRYPEMVSGVILRGVFLAEKSESDFLYNGGVELFAPYKWERFIGNVPQNKRHDPIRYFYDRMINGDNREERRKLAYEMSIFEESLLSLGPVSEADVEKGLVDYPYEALGLLEAHYFVNDCFIPEGFILNNIHRVSKVPVSIIQGKYDLVCPPLAAYKLYKTLAANDIPVDLHLVVAGHSKTDIEIRKNLISETNRICELVKNT